MKNRRIKRLLVPPEYVWASLSGKRKVTILSLPEDAQIVTSTFDPNSASFCLCISSAEFEEVPDWEIPPLFMYSVEVTP